MMTKLNPLGRISIVLFLSACATQTAQFAPAEYGRAYPVRTGGSAVEVFRSQTPSKKYIEVGAVNSCCSEDTNYLINLLRNKAAESGGDAIIALDLNATGGASATVIRYTE